MTTLFSSSRPKISKSSIFDQIYGFYFCTKLCNKTNSRASFSNMKTVFKNSSPKHPNKAFFLLDLRNSFLHETLLSEKLEGVDFKYDNNSWNSSPKIHNKVPNLIICIVAQNFAMQSGKFEGADFNYDNSIFKFPKYPNKAKFRS